MPVKHEMIFGPCQETSYIAITLNPESNFTRREKESFSIPLKYIDVSRTTRTNLDVLQERRISDEWFDMESMNLVSEDLVKLTLGGLILGDCVDLCGHLPDDWSVPAGCHEKGQQDSHVKRVMTICYLKEDQSEFQETER